MSGPVLRLLAAHPRGRVQEAMNAAAVPAVALLGLLALVPGVPKAALAQEPLSWGEMQAEMEARPRPPAVARIPYGPGEHQFGELRLPEGPGPHPVVAVIHGGCWLSIADLTYMDAFSTALNRAGWATWSLEFRRIDQDGGGWPGILEDVGAGLDHLRRIARDHPLDLGRVVAAGHSSGGHLALWLGARTSLPADSSGGPRLRGADPVPVIGSVGLAPIADLQDFTRYTRCGPTIVEDFLGEEVAPESRRLRLSDPATLAPVQTPQLILMGGLDPIVPPAHGRVYRDGVAGRGQQVDLVIVEGAGHFELVAPWTAPWSRVEARLVAFLDSVADRAAR